MQLQHRLRTVTAEPIKGHFLMKLNQVKEQFLVAFDDDMMLGEVNTQLEQALRRIAEQHHQVEFEVFVPKPATQETIGRAIQEKDAVIRVQVNVYGSYMAAQQVGKELSQSKLYLQRPVYIRDGSTYSNPHIIKLSGQQIVPFGELTPPKDQIIESRSPESLKKVVLEVYSSLTRSKNLRGLEGDHRIMTKLLK